MTMAVRLMLVVARGRQDLGRLVVRQQRRSVPRPSRAFR
jgi:hypothetical protein